jgi:hypothetical protein
MLRKSVCRSFPAGLPRFLAVGVGLLVLSCWQTCLSSSAADSSAAVTLSDEDATGTETADQETDN